MNTLNYLSLLRGKQMGFGPKMGGGGRGESDSETDRSDDSVDSIPDFFHVCRAYDNKQSNLSTQGFCKCRIGEIEKDRDISARKKQEFTTQE